MLKILIEHFYFIKHTLITGTTFLHAKLFSTFYFIILYRSQDPFENSSGTDTNPTIYFVADTSSRRKRKKRLRPNTIIEETQFSQMTTHPQSPSTSQNRNASHIDSDGDPPLINVTHHIQTEDETAYDDDFDIDNLTFIRHSQPSATTCQMPEIIGKNVYEESSSESVKVPNTQREKYHLPTDTTLSSTHNNYSSSIPNDQNCSGQLNENFIQHFPQTVFDDTHLHRTYQEDEEYENKSQPTQPTSSKPKKSTNGTYSLVAHNIKL